MQERYPFYAFLSMNMHYIETTDVPSMGVSPAGIIYYNKEWCEKLTDPELMGVLCHEVLHIVQDVATRFKPLCMEHGLFNVAADIIDNNILSYEAGLELPKEGIIPKNDSITLPAGDRSITIDDISHKTVEEVYKILEKFKSKLPKLKGFDVIIMDDPSGKGLEELAKQNPELAKQIKEGRLKPITGEQLKEMMATAGVMARQRGNISAGLERLLEMNLNPKVDWRHRLRAYLQEKLMSDYTWKRPSRRSDALGCYLPSPKKDNELEAVIHRDTSGSISDEESMQVAAEVHEICGSVGTFKLTFIDCDCDIKDIYELEDLSDLDRTKRRKGYGGTSHRPVVEWINENKPECRLFISMTDGYSDIEECYRLLPEGCNKIVVLSDSSMESKIEPHAEVIVINRMKGD